VCVPHRARPAHKAGEPVHVTLRLAIRSLRTQFVFPTVLRAIADTNRASFQVVHFSVQADHLHLIVEALDAKALAAGVLGLAVRLARRINQLVFRKGRLFADRWHGRALTSPRAVRHALVYVLSNYKKHGGRAQHGVDPYSSAPFFGEFLEWGGRTPIDAEPGVLPRSFKERDPPVQSARTWLLRRGWLRHGRVSVHEAPRQGTA
jgi:REP element-mobilizing transposase RayT